MPVVNARIENLRSCGPHRRLQALPPTPDTSRLAPECKPSPHRCEFVSLAGLKMLYCLFPASELGVRNAVAGAVGLPVGSFILKTEDGVSTVFHAGLTGDWNAVALLAPAVPPAAQGESFGF